MTRFYSDHFHATGVVSTLAGTLPLDNSVKIDQGRGGSDLQIKRARFNVGTAALIGDEIRLMTLMSSNRIYEVLVSSDGGATAGIADLGVYFTGANHDGTVLDVDLFATALVLDAAITRVDQFKESTTLNDRDRGKYLWELVNIGVPSTFPKDPAQSMDLVFTVTTSFTVAVTDVVVEVRYTAAH